MLLRQSWWRRSLAIGRVSPPSSPLVLQQICHGLQPGCTRSREQLQCHSVKHHIFSRTELSPDQDAPDKGRARGAADEQPDSYNFTLSRPTGGGTPSRPYFPFQAGFRGDDGQVFSASQVISMLAQTVMAQRMARLQQVVSSRTFAVLPVVEGLDDAGNIGAICRSADALGCGAVHVIKQGKRPMKQSRGRNSAGAEKWIDLQVWNSTAACIEGLRQQGFKVLATALHPDAVPITQWDWTQPTAVILGNETYGVSDYATAHADARIVIPMQGSMVESFNVSVAAALIMWEARTVRERCGGHADLTESQRETLLALMLLRNRGRTKQGPLVGARAF